jgi:hypothetical protein
VQVIKQMLDLVDAAEILQHEVPRLMGRLGVRRGSLISFSSTTVKWLKRGANESVILARQHNFITPASVISYLPFTI